MLREVLAGFWNRKGRYWDDRWGRFLGVWYICCFGFLVRFFREEVVVFFLV